MSMVSRACEKRPASPAEIDVAPKRQKSNDMDVSPKRQKSNDSDASAEKQKTDDKSLSTTIHRSELYSALALASLALNSPQAKGKDGKNPGTKGDDGSIDQERETENSEKNQTEEIEERAEAATVTPGSNSKSKRVTFSNEVRVDVSPNELSPQISSISNASEVFRRRRMMVIPSHRPVSLPPPHPAGHRHRHHMQPVYAHPPMPPRLPPPHFHPHHRHHPPLSPRHRLPLPMGYRPPLPPYRRWPAPHPPVPHPAHIPAHRPRVPLRAPPNYQAPPPPPPTLIESSTSSKTWICDYCNSASFKNYEDACKHEAVCKLRFKSRQQNQARQPEEKGETSSKREEDDDMRDQGEQHWFSGSVSLSVEPADSEWLSEMNCYIRKHCIEVFTATKADIMKSSKRGRIVIDQVGIRCKFCKHRPIAEKGVAAVSYPTSMAGIYESVKRWQRVHLPTCMDVPDEAQKKLDLLQNDTAWVPTTRQYWTDSARALGMVDSIDGIRFSRDPTTKPSKQWIPKEEKAPSKQGRSYSSLLTKSSAQQHFGGYICFPEDKPMIPPYVYFLMRQVEPCFFTEADRFVARSKGPVGFAGFQCRHCTGHAGLGKYFPLNSKALSTNSTSQNIHAHLLKCRKCPPAIKEELVYLKAEKTKSPRLVPGWRKTFFERVWERMHGDDANI